MIELIRTIAQDTPTLFEIEDAHWIDATSSALLGAIVAGEAGTAPQVAITGRPEFDPGWAAEDGVLALRLEPLKEGDVRAMIRSVLGVATVEPRLERIVVDKSEGTPLFVEEILRSLRQRDALVVMADSAALAPDAAEDAADGNLQQLVLQGVDRLSPEVKPILYAAAAMGRNFSHSVLSEIAPPARVEAALEVAGERGLVEYDPTSGEDGWRFSHALLRDAVYSSLLDEARETVHGQIALAMERAPSLHNRDLSQELGYHFSKAGMGRNAVPHLLQAARNNLQVYALSQAKALLAQAAEFLEEDPDILTATEFTRMVRDQVSLGLNIGDSRMIIDAVEQDLERLRSTDNPSDYERIISHYSWALSHARRYDEAFEVAEEAAAKARDRGDLLSAAWQQVGYLRACNETHKLGTDQFMAVANDALETARKHGEVRLEMQILYLMSAEFRAAGDFRSSRECCRRLEQLAEEYNEPRAIGFSRWTESVLYQMAREFGTALRLAEEARAVSVPETADAHVSDGIAVGAIVNGPDPTSAAPIIEEIRRKATEFLDYNLIDLMEVCQAVMELRTGRLAQGWHRFQSVVDTASQRGNRSHLLAMILVRAEVRARIAGLVENDEPEEYQVRDPMKLGLKDLMLALRIRLGSRKGVLQDIADYEATAPEWVGGAWRARFLLTRSLIEKDPARKRADLEEVEVLARQEGLEFLAKRASVLLQGMA
jgi:tetratricopeptide (TPR) repeat protein